MYRWEIAFRDASRTRCRFYYWADNIAEAIAIVVREEGDSVEIYQVNRTDTR